MESTLLDLVKAENPEAYKKIAEKGLMLAYPATIRGKTHRPDIGMRYHTTIKMFDSDKETPESVSGHVEKLDYPSIDPRKVRVSPAVLKDRFGNDTYAIKLQGEHESHIQENRKKLQQFGYPGHKIDHPSHITVDKKTFDEVFAKKPTTAHEAGITWGPAELRAGHKVLDIYHSKEESHEKLAASEKHLDTSSIRTLIIITPELQPHMKALALDDKILKNYVEDHPVLAKSLVERQDKRFEHHFGEDIELINIAWTRGLGEAYKVLNNRGK